MFRQIYESSVLEYRQPPDGYSPVYNGYLLTPPRIYFEEIALVHGMFTIPQRTPTSQFVVCVQVTTNQTYFPGAGGRVFKWDGTTGEYLGGVDISVSIGELFAADVTQGQDGSLWQHTSYGSDYFYERDPETFLAVPGSTRYATEFGSITMKYTMVDRTNNIVVALTNNDTAGNSISVFDFTTGDLLRRINVSGDVVQIVAEDDGKCFVISDNSIFNSVNYLTGDILSTLRTPTDVTANSRFAWSKQMKRFLAFEYVDDDTDGAALSKVTGFYPVPIAAALTTPIPLRSPRAGRKVPVLLRVIGDAGEGITAGRPTVTVTGDGTLSTAASTPDSAGDVLAYVNCTDAGSVTVSASMNT